MACLDALPAILVLATHFMVFWGFLLLARLLSKILSTGYFYYRAFFTAGFIFGVMPNPPCIVESIYFGFYCWSHSRQTDGLNRQNKLDDE